MVADIPVKQNTSIVYIQKKSDDTTLDKNLCNYDLLTKIYGNLIENENVRITSTRGFININDEINTSLHQVAGTEKYISIQNKDQKDLIEVASFIKKLESLYRVNSDSAIVYVFDILDDWSPIKDINKFNRLFTSLINIEFNEDIYVSILSSTILIKNNLERKKYYNFVSAQLNQKYDEDELQFVLKGL